MYCESQGVIRCQCTVTLVVYDSFVSRLKYGPQLKFRREVLCNVNNSSQSINQFIATAIHSSQMEQPLQERVSKSSMNAQCRKCDTDIAQLISETAHRYQIQYNTTLLYY